MMEEGIGRHSKLVTVIASYRLEDLCVSRRGKRFKIIEESAPLVLPSGGTARWNNFRDRLCSPLNPGSLLIFLDVQELGSQLCRPRTDWKESGAGAFGIRMGGRSWRGGLLVIANPSRFDLVSFSSRFRGSLCLELCQKIANHVYRTNL